MICFPPRITVADASELSVVGGGTGSVGGAYVVLEARHFVLATVGSAVECAVGTHERCKVQGCEMFRHMYHK